jgi:hypothetical protein
MKLRKLNFDIPTTGNLGDTSQREIAPSPHLHLCNTTRVRMPEEGMVSDASSCPP